MCSDFRGETSPPQSYREPLAGWLGWKEGFIRAEINIYLYSERQSGEVRRETGDWREKDEVKVGSSSELSHWYSARLSAQ